ncbi:uncharacterized protein [Rutidosis leptorrhynchoides]|uniref:uncharacterized protein n=1 Tax=Rutidosis leptorrhynchoides TaxID=125765 RepID=UPI003A9A4FFD
MGQRLDVQWSIYLHPKGSRTPITKSKLPNGLLAIKEITEFGYNQKTGFFWIKQAKKSDHKFRALNKNAQYETEVVGFIEEGKMNTISGFKVKAMTVWFAVTDICIDQKDPEKLSFSVLELPRVSLLLHLSFRINETSPNT